MTTRNSVTGEHIPDSKTSQGTNSLFILLSKENIDRVMSDLRHFIFPDVYLSREESDPATIYQQLLHSIIQQMHVLIEAGLSIRPSDSGIRLSCIDITKQFVEELPRIQEMLISDVEAVRRNDPAATSRIEIICCYPAITVMLHYRIAHILYKIGIPLLPRMITEHAHSITGIDIHPAAQIGKSFGIDHGTGIVIGETTIIGDDVMIYQGVTLGAKNFHKSEEGDILNIPRHPIIEDHVTIYSNSTILGRIRIGHDTIIGGNLWITKDIAPYSRVRQSKPQKFSGFIDGEGI